MYPNLADRVDKLIADFDASVLTERRVGLEKESLRVAADGGIAQTDHPGSLGSALTNSAITTDFSEALLEMVTPPCATAGAALDYLTGLHQFILPRLPAGEHLWNTSMPCILSGENSIRIGQYGESHTGKMKHAYRRGLGLRYGRRMQAIAGIHFNFSLPITSWNIWQLLHQNGSGSQFGGTAGYPDSSDELALQALATDGYFHMMRNLMRIGWLVPYLFGASPAICHSFLPEGGKSDLDTYNEHTRFAPFGTSLRMGEIGYRYREDSPIDLSVRHDTFDHYLEDLLAHVSTVHPAYSELGIQDQRGRYQQLNACRLQIENEYYSSVRPKQIPEPGEMPILALQHRGIRYLELRSVDVNLLEPTGLSLEQIAMLEMLMIFTWLADSPALSDAEMSLNKNNVYAVAHHGRTPGLKLDHFDGETRLSTWGLNIMDHLRPIAVWLDGAGKDNLYQHALQQQVEKLHNPDKTPSANVLRAMFAHGSFFEYAQAVSREHHEAILALPIEPGLDSQLAEGVVNSVARKADLEAESTCSFGDFLQQYFSQLDCANARSSCA